MCLSQIFTKRTAYKNTNSTFRPKTRTKASKHTQTQRCVRVCARPVGVGLLSDGCQCVVGVATVPGSVLFAPDNSLVVVAPVGL